MAPRGCCDGREAAMAGASRRHGFAINDRTAPGRRLCRGVPGGAGQVAPFGKASSAGSKVAQAGAELVQMTQSGRMPSG